MFLIPIGNDQTLRRFPWLTAGIMALCVLLQVHRSLRPDTERALDEERVAIEHRVEELRQMRPARPPGGDDRSDIEADPKMRELIERAEWIKQRDPIFRFGYRASDGLSYRTLVAAFLHGGWLHLIGNMLFLWLVGCNLEDRWGSLVFGLFYVAGAFASDAAYAFANQGSDIPSVGASGAIAAAMGAFLICYHGASIRFWYLFWFWSSLQRGTFMLRAIYVLPFWFLDQVVSARLDEAEGIAYSAHIGGFLFGMVAAVLLKWTGLDARRNEARSSEGRVHEGASDPAEEFAAIGAVGADPADAAMRLRRFVARHPQHLDAKLLLCRLSLQAAEPASLHAFVPQTVMALCKGGRASEALELFRAVEAAHPSLDLGEEPLVALFEAARAAGDRSRLFALGSRLLREHPRSRNIPAACWVLATEFESASRLDLAHPLLTRLATEYSEEPVGRMARERIQAISGMNVAPRGDQFAANAASQFQPPHVARADPFAPDDGPPIELDLSPPRRR